MCEPVFRVSEFEGGLPRVNGQTDRSRGSKRSEERRQCVEQQRNSINAPIPAVGKGVGIGFRTAETRNEFELCPINSSLRSRRSGERRLSRRSLGVGGHFAVYKINVASYDSASQPWQRLRTFIFFKASVIPSDFTQGGLAICVSASDGTIKVVFRTHRNGCRGA